MQQHLLQKKKSANEINVKVDNMYNDLNNKYKAISTHLKVLDTQVAQTADTMKRQQGVLPAKGEQNPREFVNAIALRSGRVLEPVERQETNADVVIDLEEQDEQEAEKIQNPAEKLTAQPLVRVYASKVPYPTHPKKSRTDLDEAKCREMLDDLIVKLPLVDAIQMIPSIKRYMKSLVTSKVSGEEDFVKVTKDCSGYTKFKQTKISLVFADRSLNLPVGILEDLHVRIGNALISADFGVLELAEEPNDPFILGRPFRCTGGALIDVQNW
ncbi:hypothetical protein V5N11_017087 [Cardamine amara subsp. amara]|uniref:Uncharacterized protein n=1 Tax=Cardamine amara subsp. amara TaxID=228776 RepID=A0ABD0ZRS6_CARAN